MNGLILLYYIFLISDLRQSWKVEHKLSDILFLVFIAVIGGAEGWDEIQDFGDEIQLTDAIDMLMAEESVEAFHMTGKSHDCGDKLGYLKAFVEYGLRHPTLGKEFEDYLHSVMASEKSLSLVS